MIANEFHKLSVELELESILLTTQQFTLCFGALNWRESSVLEKLANVNGQHPIKYALTELAEWLDSYAQGTATGEKWLEVMQYASRVQQIADASIYEWNNRNNPLWQAAKAAAMIPLSNESLFPSTERQQESTES